MSDVLNFFDDVTRLDLAQKVDPVGDIALPAALPCPINFARNHLETLWQHKVWHVACRQVGAVPKEPYLPSNKFLPAGVMSSGTRSVHANLHTVVSVNAYIYI